MFNYKIALIGLGYVGLPLARLLSTKHPVVGYDIDEKRILELRKGIDKTLEVSNELLNTVICSTNPVNSNSKKGLFFSSDKKDLECCNTYIITVPTPTDSLNRPDLTLLIKASKMVGKLLKKGDIIIYESTVYPGATEEKCVPVLETYSTLKFNLDFFVGYSPERINPGDKIHTVENIKKVTSGSTTKTGEIVDYLYRSVIVSGTHLAPSIKVAEAAKVIENTQRDINIAFVNELAKIFNLLGIDTNEVLEAAGTKWNFLPFKPGLVGGHCIGVDPFYLAQKAIEVGYHPEIILAGRRMNDSMSKYVSEEVIKLMLKSGIGVKDSNILLMGITFKENCTDIRNSKAIDIYLELKSFGANVSIYDPWAEPTDVKKAIGIPHLTSFPTQKFEAIILAVAHTEFIQVNFEELKSMENSIIYDIKSILPKQIVSQRL